MAKSDAFSVLAICLDIPHFLSKVTFETYVRRAKRTRSLTKRAPTTKLGEGKYPISGMPLTANNPDDCRSFGRDSESWILLSKGRESREGLEGQEGRQGGHGRQGRPGRPGQPRRPGGRDGRDGRAGREQHATAEDAEDAENTQGRESLEGREGLEGRKGLEVYFNGIRMPPVKMPASKPVVARYRSYCSVNVEPAGMARSPPFGVTSSRAVALFESKGKRRKSPV